MNSIEIPIPDDFHLHLRDGPGMMYNILYKLLQNNNNTDIFQ